MVILVVTRPPPPIFIPKCVVNYGMHTADHVLSVEFCPCTKDLILKLWT